MPVRPLPPVAVSLLLGSLTGIGAAYLPISSLILTTVLLLGLVLFTRRTYHPAYTCFIFGAFLFGAAAAVVAQYRTTPVFTDKVDLVGEIVEPVRYGVGHAAIVLSLHRAESNNDSVPVTGRIRLNIRGDAPPLVMGDVISFQSRLRPPHRQLNPAGFDYEAYLRHHGIQAVGSLTMEDDRHRLQRLVHVPHRGFDLIDSWRGTLREIALDSLDPDAASIFLALITGESGYLSQNIRDAFMTSGTTHILSISGSHLGLIAVVVFAVVRQATLMLPASWLLRITLRTTPSRVAAMATLPVVTFYAILGGAEVATVRSLLMLGIFLGAVLLGRTHTLGTGLALALLLIVAWDPMAPLDLSFQLSFLSVLVIVLVTRQSHDFSGSAIGNCRSQWILARSKIWLRQILLITLAVTVVTAPLVALHFRQLAWVGLIANLFVIPFVGFGVVPLGLMSALATLLSGSPMLVAAPVLQSSIDVLLWVVGALGSLPGARWMVASPSVWQVLVFYMCIAVVVLRLGGPWTVRTAVGVATALLVLWAWSPRDLPPAGTVRATFLDVGQGDAAVIETSEGQVMIIDGGGASEWWDQGRAVVAPYLWDRGIRRVDVVIATHPQLDHVGGLASIVRDFPIGEFWTNGIVREAIFVHRLEQALQAKRVHMRMVSSRDRPSVLGPCQVSIANPDSVLTPVSLASTGKHLNNQSVVTRIQCGTRSMLFAGDIEEDAEARLVAAGQLWTDVLKVPHHGSRGSLYEPFLRAVNAQVAVVSVGHANSYGHPAPAMLEMYRQLNSAVLRTDRDGAVTILSSGAELRVGCESGRRLKRIRLGSAQSGLEEWRNLGRLGTRMGPCVGMS